MPLGVLSVAQTRAALEEVDQTTLEGVGGAAMQAVRSQIEAINEARISARVLASVLSQSLNEGTACVDRVGAVARDLPQATLVAFIPLSGLMTCSSNGRVYDFAGEAVFEDLIARPEPRLVYNPEGSVSGTAVIGISHPVFDRQGKQAGIVAISLSYTAIAPSTYTDAVALWRPEYLGTFQADGTVLLSSDPAADPAKAIPGQVPLAQLSSLIDQPAFLDDEKGQRILSVVGVTSDLFLVSVWSRAADGFWSRASAATPYLLPGLTWVAAFAVAAFASSRLVVRHVRALARSMADYVTSQERVQIPDLVDAPTEIQSLHAAYEGLINTIVQEEAELQNLLIDKDNLLREVNHRSGNSLQVIASIMRSYRREATDPKLQAVLDGLINRVIALSSTHTSLYSVSGQRDVAMDEILAHVVRRLKEIHGVPMGVAAKRLEPIRMDAQAAIPLALALAEAMGCFFVLRQLGQNEVTVALSQSERMIKLSVEGPTVPELLPETTVGLAALPQRMLRQFATQLRGTISIAHDAGRARVDLVFPQPVPHPAA